MRVLVRLLVAMVAVFAWATPVEAVVRMGGEKEVVVVAEDEVVDDDLWIAGETVEIRGTVNGDVYVGAGVVRFSGKTTGDLVIGGGEVRVSGAVGDDLWIGAGNVNLSGVVVGDGVSIGAGSVTIDSDSQVGGSMMVGSGMVDTRAPVARNLLIGAGQVRMDAKVGGEMRVAADEIGLGPKTAIGKDLIYMAEREPRIDEAAVVKGEIRAVENQYAKQSKDWEKEARAAWPGVRAGMNVLSYLGALIVGLAGVWLVRKPLLGVAEQITKNMLASLGWGLLVVVLAGPAWVMLMATGIGIPLAMIGLVLLLVDFYLAKVVVSMAAGQAMAKQLGWEKMRTGWVYVLGLTTYYVLRMIPMVGMFVRLVVFLAGVGGIALQLKARKK